MVLLFHHVSRAMDRGKMYVMQWIFLIIILAYIFPPPAHAYLDPGTGSYIVQIVIASALGGVVGLKSYWGKIKKIFRKNSQTSSESDDKDEKKKTD